MLDESSSENPIEFVKWRILHEQRLLAANIAGLRTVIIRPGCVYGKADGLTALWFSSAHGGSVEVVGNGLNHWCMVHVKDLAEAYVLAAEKELSGVVLNIVDHTHYT